MYQINFLFALIFILCYGTLYTRNLNIIAENRIVNGELTSIEKHPYAACIYLDVRMDVPRRCFCGATIVSNEWLLTAAHCITDIEESIGMKYAKIRTGNNFWDRGTLRTILEHFNHPSFDPSTINNDIGLLRVAKIISGMVERPIPVAGKYYQYKTDSTVTAVGWGITKAGSLAGSDQLRQVKLSLISPESCRKYYNRYLNRNITDKMVCTLTSKKDACKSDSGGPLVQAGILIGIISWGKGCADPLYPGVFTKVSVFEDWFQKIEKVRGIKLNITFSNN